MPNIMKIRQCFLKLQLKMSGIFFETHCTCVSQQKRMQSSFTPYCQQLTFNDVEADVTDKELVPFAGITSRLVHPALHFELQQMTGQIQQRNRYQVRLPFHRQCCTQTAHNTVQWAWISHQRITSNNYSNDNNNKCLLSKERPQTNAGISRHVSKMAVTPFNPP